MSPEPTSSGATRGILAWTFMGSVVSLAAVGLLVLWGSTLGGLVGEVTLSLLVVAVLSGVLIALTLHRARSQYGWITTAVASLSVALGLLFLAKIWMSGLDHAVFAKLAGTLVILLVVLAFLGAATADLSEDRKLREQNYLD
ncbi:MAG: hypothetical protein AAF726_03265 [Planctomycetota bacterium]